MDAEGVKAARGGREDTSDIEIALLLEAIYRKYHYDFREYALPPLQRRLGQACAKFGWRTLTELQDGIMHDPSVFAALLDYLTIQFSEMFRDPSYFRSLRETVLPILRTYPSLKAWCSGCGSGEEAYSLAILFREEGLLQRTMIYATDINPHALKKAEAAVYDIDRLPSFSRNYLQSGGRASLADYYTAAYGAVAFDKTLQRHVLFADHSLATDAVFSEVQLISCRNVLIYFEPGLQSRCFELFHEALCWKGFLGLGSKETLRSTKWASCFESVVAKDRIFRKIA
jgi:chemotaxis protein methyltransferase CheR